MSTEVAPPALPKSFLRPCVLLLLREESAHGYELLERLRPLGFEVGDAGGLYRTLRALEQDGLVHSAWERSNAGPQRRIYRLTRAGREELHRQARSLTATCELLEAFLGRYEEFVALPRRGEPASVARGG